MKETIHVTICTGTTCFVMGGSDLLMLEDHLPAYLKDLVKIKGSTCMNYCKENLTQKAPFVEINGVVMEQATVPGVIQKLQEIYRDAR